MALRSGYCAVTRSGDAGDCGAASSKGSKALHELLEPKLARLPARALLACRAPCGATRDPAAAA